MSLIIHTKELVKTYSSRTVVNHVSVNVKQGEIVGLLGPNGAGKTTTFYMVVGLIKPDEGEVYLDDVDITKLVAALNKKKRNYPEAGDLLHAIYSGQQLDGTNAQNGRWASALAAFSTDEDFVETFQLFVLMHAQTQPQVPVSGPLQNLRVIIYGSKKNVGGHVVPYADDVPATFNSKQELMRKSGCFSYLTL